MIKLLFSNNFKIKMNKSEKPTSGIKENMAERRLEAQKRVAPLIEKAPKFQAESKAKFGVL
jgi:hypothetical protein